MSNLKKIIFREQDEQLESQSQKEEFYYSEDGFIQAGYVDGKIIPLRFHLNKIYQSYIQYRKRSAETTRNIDDALLKEKTSYSNEKNNITSIIENNEKFKIPELDSKIEKLTQQIHDIQENPKSIDIEKPDKLGYYIGVFILIFLSIYLWIFYSSATYSAFFREIKFTENAVFNSIFYANSIAEAYEMGLAALILTLVSPFIFIALGYLIHRFLEDRKYFNLIFFVSVTFLFDCIIAYEITKKIYEALALNSLQNVPSYKLEMAIQDVNFYLIIFAGFVVYIVWGKILNFVSDGYKSLDTVKAAVTKRKKQIDEILTEKSRIKAETVELKNKIVVLEGQIKSVEQSIKGVPFYRKEFEKTVQEFMTGWLRYLAQRNSSKEQLEEAEKVCNNFLENVSQSLQS